MAAGDDVLLRLDNLIETATALAHQADRGGDMSREFYAELTGWRVRSITAIGSIVAREIHAESEAEEASA